MKRFPVRISAMATYHDLRERTGLSLSTISKYFNGGNVLEQNRRAIDRAVAELDFQPNEFARSLRSRKSRTVGVAVPSLASSFHMQIVAAIESELRGHGVSLMVRCNGYEDPEHEPDDAVAFLAGKLVDGLIVASSPPDLETLKKLKHLPIVMFDRPADGVTADVVLLDNEDAGAQAARLLLDHGHRRIGLLGGDPEVWTMPHRDAGFLDVLAARKLELPPEYRLSQPLTIAGGAEGVRKLLALRERPTAIFTTNYQLTIGALAALNDSGLRIPQDVSLVGFDIDEISQVTRPKTTTLLQPITQIASESARLLLERLALPAEEQPAPQQILLRAHLVLGGSVARPE
jgi:LacI family transcriptional regulator